MDQLNEWYCTSQGQQFGPIDEFTLRRWIAERRVAQTDMVWCQGMAEWRFAREVFPDAFPTYGYATAATPLAPPRQTTGTGGQTPNAELRRQALAVLRGRWGLAIGFTLLLGLMQGAIGNVPFLGGAARLVLDGPFALGAVIFSLSYTRTGSGELGMMFRGFNDFGRALGAYLLVALITFAWSLLLIVPGIIAALAYSQTMYLVADHPTLGPWDAMKLSKQMMDGHKGRLFCMWLFYFLLGLGCILTLFIGFLWLMPFIHVTNARFYDDLCSANGFTPPGPRGFAVVANPGSPQV